MVVDLNNAGTARNFQRRAIDPHDTGDVHPSIRRDTREVNKVGDFEDVVRHPGHLLVIAVEIGSGSAEDGELGVAERRKCMGFGVVTTLKTSGV